MPNRVNRYRDRCSCTVGASRQFLAVFGSALLMVDAAFGEMNAQWKST